MPPKRLEPNFNPLGRPLLLFEPTANFPGRVRPACVVGMEPGRIRAKDVSLSSDPPAPDSVGREPATLMSDFAG